LPGDGVVGLLVIVEHNAAIRQGEIGDVALGADDAADR